MDIPDYRGALNFFPSPLPLLSGRVRAEGKYGVFAFPRLSSFSPYPTFLRFPSEIQDGGYKRRKTYSPSRNTHNAGYKLPHNIILFLEQC